MSVYFHATCGCAWDLMVEISLDCFVVICLSPVFVYPLVLFFNFNWNLLGLRSGDSVVECHYVCFCYFDCNRPSSCPLSYACSSLPQLHPHLNIFLWKALSRHQMTVPSAMYSMYLSLVFTDQNNSVPDYRLLGFCPTWLCFRPFSERLGQFCFRQSFCLSTCHMRHC